MVGGVVAMDFASSVVVGLSLVVLLMCQMFLLLQFFFIFNVDSVKVLYLLLNEK